MLLNAMNHMYESRDLNEGERFVYLIKESIEKLTEGLE